MVKGWISRYWPVVVVTAFNLLLWAVTQSMPRPRGVWVFYAGRALQVAIMAFVWWFCWRFRPRRFRVFAEDHPGSGTYNSVVFDVTTLSACYACGLARGLFHTDWKGRYMALPHDRKDLWPDVAGRVPPEALKFR